MKIFSTLDTQYNKFSNSVSAYLSNKLSAYGTKFGSNTIFGQILTVVGNAIQNIMLYIEDALVEQNKYTAQRKKSIYNLASLSGYTPFYGKAATVPIKLSFTPINAAEYNIIINNHEPLTCTQNGLQYNIILPQEAIILNIEKDNTTKYLSAVQGRFESQSFVSAGGQYYTIPFKFLGNIDTDYLYVKVNNEKWEYCSSLYNMTPDGQQYTFKASIDGGIDLIFGNNQYGRALKPNDFIEITYLIHDGENGNVNPELETYLVFENSLLDVNGESYDGNTIFNVTFSETDPVISGCNSESIESVRQMIGLNSRSLVLASADNYKTFLNKFGFCGYSRTWSDSNSMIVNSLIVKNFGSKIANGVDYFSLTENDFILNDTQKNAIYNFLEYSGNQMLGVKYKIFDPDICKYAMYVYVSLKSNKYDKAFVSNAIRQKIGEFFSNIKSDMFIPKSDIIHLLKTEVEGIDGVDVYILSEKNETAIITGIYSEDVYILNNITGQYIKKTENVKLYSGENPNIGLDNHGNIWLKSDTQFPVLMGGWKYRINNENNEESFVDITDPLIITIEE